jgi:hypothetical protein
MDMVMAMDIPELLNSSVSNIHYMLKYG